MFLTWTSLFPTLISVCVVCWSPGLWLFFLTLMLDCVFCYCCYGLIKTVIFTYLVFSICITELLCHNLEVSEDAHLIESLTAQGHFLGEQERCLQEVTAQVQQLTSNLTLSTHTPTTTTTSHNMIQPTLARLDKYSREATYCIGFFLQCEFYFAEIKGLTESTKISQFITLLSEEVLLCAMVVWHK